MNFSKIISFFSLLILFSGCELDNSDPSDYGYAELHYTFVSGLDGWVAGFSDYPKDEETNYQLSAQHVNLPEPLDVNRKAILLSGNNHSDDLFMYVKRKIIGLEPNTYYYLTFNVKLASNIANNTVGIGGSPGESVYLKVGGSTIEPVSVVDNDGTYRMNIDKGNQAQSGINMVTIGDFSNGTDTNEYAFKTIWNNAPVAVKTNDNGELWLITGSDSGFEGVTNLYFSVISIIFEW